MADDISTLRRILKSCRTIAVVGLSAEWHRPSFFAAKYLQQHGYRIVPVNPRYPQILGQTCYTRLEDIPFPVDMVDVFRKAADVPPYSAPAATTWSPACRMVISAIASAAMPDALATAARPPSSAATRSSSAATVGLLRRE